MLFRSAPMWAKATKRVCLGKSILLPLMNLNSRARPLVIVLLFGFLCRGLRLHNKGDLDRGRLSSQDICLFSQLNRAGMLSGRGRTRCKRKLWIYRANPLLFVRSSSSSPASKHEGFYSRHPQHDSTPPLSHDRGREIFPASKRGLWVFE